MVSRKLFLPVEAAALAFVFNLTSRRFCVDQLESANPSVMAPLRHGPTSCFNESIVAL